jgi:hypothetical protein
MGCTLSALHPQSDRTTVTAQCFTYKRILLHLVCTCISIEVFRFQGENSSTIDLKGLDG